LELTRRKKQLEVSTEVEALGVESQHNQIHYRALSEEKDLELAKLKAAALLNIPEDLPEDLPDPDENFNPDSAARLETDVSALLDQAASHRPELIAAAHAARFHSYGYKAARAEGRLHVDASGFVGRGGGAFASEPLELRHSWNAGVQAKLYFIGNSVKGNASRDRTSPDLGETSRTDTDARSAEIGFLDGFKQIADKRQSRVARDRAAMEYDQTRRQVEVDVREAYYNMEKALIQLKAERLNVEFRRKEATIARQKERLNLVEPSQRLAAEGLYTDAQVAFDEAVAFYRVAIASLEKAVGVPADTLLK
ncbi:MAG: TolC family protein, partial [Elusimicrobiota bacterium]